MFEISKYIILLLKMPKTHFIQHKMTSLSHHGLVAFLSHAHAGNKGSIPVGHKPKSLKQLATAPLPKAQQQVTRVLGDDHYKGLARVTVGVAR